VRARRGKIEEVRSSSGTPLRNNKVQREALSDRAAVNMIETTYKQKG
jgi:hypothetical protein